VLAWRERSLAASNFNGSLELTTRQLTGHVTVPEFTTRLKALALPVDATLQLVEVQPVTGHVTCGSPNITIGATTSATLKIRRLSSSLLPLNLVGHACQTSEPVVLPLHYVGPPTLFTGFTFNGTTTIPLAQALWAGHAASEPAHGWKRQRLHGHNRTVVCYGPGLGPESPRPRGLSAPGGLPASLPGSLLARLRERDRHWVRRPEWACFRRVDSPASSSDSAGPR
jgi:hypothetical protein